MPPTKFTSSTQFAIASAIREGVSIPDAARGNDVAPDTVKTWLAKGRKNPDGPYGEFAEMVAEALEFRDLGASENPTDAVPSKEELHRRLDAASKKGSVRATQLLLEIRAREDDRDGDESVEDEFGALESPQDELAQARSKRAT